MDEDNQPIVYVVDTRNADHRTGSSRPMRMLGVPPSQPAGNARPRPVMLQPAQVYQSAPYYQPAPVPAMPSWLANVSRGEIVDLIIQGLVALTPLPAAPVATGKAEVDVENLTLFNGAVALHTKRDEQLRTLGYALRKLLA